MLEQKSRGKYCSRNNKHSSRNFITIRQSKFSFNYRCKKISDNNWEVFTENGREKTENVVEWAKQANQLIGEILLTSIDKDGTMKGPDIELVKNKKVIDVPLIVSGGLVK